MGKLIPVLCAGVGTAAVSVGGVYLLNSGSSYADMGCKTLEEFKNKKGGPLTEGFFGKDLDFGSAGITELSTSSTLENTYFTQASSDANDKGTGLLVINWEKTDSTSAASEDQKKWRGGFRWLWHFRKGGKGFAMFVSAKPSSTENTLDLEGGFYTLESDSNTKKWSVKKKKELPASGTLKAVNSTDLEKTLPKAHTNITSSLKGIDDDRKNYWGFIKDKDDMGKVCKNDASVTCPASPADSEKIFRRMWTWHPSDAAGTTTKLADWSTNFEALSKHLFDDIKLKEALDNLKGTWK